MQFVIDDNEVCDYREMKADWRILLRENKTW
jgi:hypothetical protein